MYPTLDERFQLEIRKTQIEDGYVSMYPTLDERFQPFNARAVVSSHVAFQCIPLWMSGFNLPSKTQ